MKRMKLWGIGVIASFICLSLTTVHSEASVLTAGKQHIGTFEGSTTFTTSSSNRINPGLFIEVRDKDGKLQQYTSEDGMITVPNTKEGAYVTQAKLLGKTKYVDQETGEILDEWEEGRNLTLESSKMPVLTTEGKNLFDGNFEIGNINATTGANYSGTTTVRTTGYFPVSENITFTISFTNSNFANKSGLIVCFYDENKNFISSKSDNLIKTPSNTKYIRIRTRKTDSTKITKEELESLKCQIEYGSIVTNYEPYQSNILTVNEEVILRSNENVYDALDLLAGKSTQRINEDGEVLSQEIIKIVDLNATYEFNRLKDSHIQVEGNVVPIVYSITVPTEPLTFKINPNAKEGEQFIAPNFSITNESKGPVHLELKSFQQTTDIFNDVLPEEHENWNLLTLKQSKDIALAVIPKTSDGWLILNEGPKYVANTEVNELGVK